MVGRKGANYSGIVIPYFHPGSDNVREYRLRRDHPDLEYDAGGNLKAKQKYLTPPGRPNMLYLPPGVPRLHLRDPAMPIMITEGEFKTLALWRAANHGAASRPRFLPDKRGRTSLVPAGGIGAGGSNNPPDNAGYQLSTHRSPKSR